jgi:hypothetical protein
MRTNTWQALIVLLIVLGFVTLGAWVATVGSPAVIWSFRIGAPAAALGVIAVMVKVWRRRDGELTDHLRNLAGRYFEQDGFCFLPVVETTNDGTQSFLSIYFQNRFERPAAAKVFVRPGIRSFRATRHPLPKVLVDIDCPGAAFGVVRVPFPIPGKYHGKSVTFDVAADAAYPAGRGKLLRVRGGARVGSTRQLTDGGQFLSFLVCLLIGVISQQQAAAVTLQLPEGVADDDSREPGAPLPPEILWQPAGDGPTGGFPVLPRRAA